MSDNHAEGFVYYQSIIDQIPDTMCLVKDLDSRFIVTNKLGAKLFGYPNCEALHGIYDEGMRCPAAEHAEEFRRQDRFVIENTTTIKLIDIHTYADGGQKILLTEKSPFYLKGELAGILCICNEIKNDFFRQLGQFLTETGNHFTPPPPAGGSISYCLGSPIGASDLTERELDCVFYLARGCSMKEIALRLQIKWKTVEGYLDRVKRKWNCQNKGMIIDRAISEGYLNCIPPHLLNGGHSWMMDEPPPEEA